MEKVTVCVSCTENETTVMASIKSPEIFKFTIMELLAFSLCNPDDLLLYCLHGRGIYFPITSIENVLLFIAHGHPDYESGMVISASINGQYWEEDLQKAGERAFYVKKSKAL